MYPLAPGNTKSDIRGRLISLRRAYLPAMVK
jgi:hypothetical protein